ncbi:MAG: hypothetical protein GC151_04420 [Betaproteobacteria bacterium]|nr:hypothetical protein [Betaproteobacteria bacterium]
MRRTRAAGTVPGARLFCGLLMLTLWIALPAGAAEPPPAGACGPGVTGAMLQAMDRATGRRVQEAIVQVYGHDPDFPARDADARARLSDGRFGPVTWTWLQRFCSDVSVSDLPPDSGGAVSALLSFAGVTGRHPEWRSLLLSPPLSRWIDAKGTAARVQSLTTRVYGTDEEISALLRNYEDETRPRTAESNTVAVYFRLDDDGVKRLAAPAAALAAMKKLEGKPPMNAEQFDAAVTAALGGAQLPPDTYLPIVERHAKSQVTHQVTADTVRSLRVQLVPAPVVAVVASVQDLPFPDVTDLVAALRAAEKDAADKGDKAVAPAGTAAPAATTAPAKDADPVSTGTPATPAPASSAAGVAPAGPPGSGDAKPGAATTSSGKEPASPARSTTSAGEAATAASAAPVQTEAPLAAQPPRGSPARSILTPYLKEILAAVVAKPAYAWTAVSTRELGADPAFGVLPAFLGPVLHGIVEVEYPTEYLFREAVQAKIVDAFMQGGRPPKYDKTLKTIDAIRKLDAPPEYVAAAERVAARDYANSRHLRNAMRRALDPLSDRYLGPIEAVARKTHPFRQTQPIEWEGAGCGCVQSNRLPGGWVDASGQRSPGVVYGLFPLWQAGHPEQIDFSVVSTVGYYAVPFDDDGQLLDPLAGDDSNLAFAKMARRYGTRVDWVIRRTDWRSWQALTKEKRVHAFDNLVGNIEKMLTQTSSNWLDRFLDGLSFGAIPVLTRGDGVTLYFDNYPTDAESVAEFQVFHRKLNATLASAIGQNYAVNLLFPHRDLGQGIYECNRLTELMQRADGGPGTNSGNFLVLLAEPTIDTKKALRQNVEDCLSGERRKELQQAIVPVIEYDGTSQDQLRDDIVYFDFNFGGVGLWPHPVGLKAPPARTTAPAGKAGQAPAAADEERVGGDIRSILLGRNLDVGATQEKVDAVCRIVCPNRWVFRGLFEAFVVLLVVSLVFRWASCRLSFTLRARPLYFYVYMACVVVPTLVLFLSLLYCDPAWADIREGNIPFILLALVFMTFVVWLYVNARKEASRP